MPAYHFCVWNIIFGKHILYQLQTYLVTVTTVLDNLYHIVPSSVEKNVKKIPFVRPGGNITKTMCVIIDFILAVTSRKVSSMLKIAQPSL